MSSGGQICNLCKWRHLVAIFATNASVAIRWPNLQLMKVAPYGRHICKLCKWRHLVTKFATYASDAILLSSSIQVTESISGSVVPLAMFRLYDLFKPQRWANLKILVVESLKTPWTFRAESKLGRRFFFNPFQGEYQQMVVKMRRSSLTSTLSFCWLLSLFSLTRRSRNDSRQLLPYSLIQR